MFNSVLNIFVFLTVHECHDTSIKSQILNGFKSNIIIHPAIFCKVPERAIPIAKPAAASIATNELVCTHKTHAAIIITKIFNDIFIRLNINHLSIGVILCF